MCTVCSTASFVNFVPPRQHLVSVSKPINKSRPRSKSRSKSPYKDALRRMWIRKQQKKYNKKPKVFKPKGNTAPPKDKMHYTDPAIKDCRCMPGVKCGCNDRPISKENKLCRCKKGAKCSCHKTEYGLDKPHIGIIQDPLVRPAIGIVKKDTVKPVITVVQPDVIQPAITAVKPELVKPAVTLVKPEVIKTDSVVVVDKKPKQAIVVDAETGVANIATTSEPTIKTLGTAKDTSITDVAAIEDNEVAETDEEGSNTGIWIALGLVIIAGLVFLFK